MRTSYYQERWMTFWEIFKKAGYAPGLDRLERLTKDGTLPGGPTAKVPYLVAQHYLGEQKTKEIFGE